MSKKDKGTNNIKEDSKIKVWMNNKLIPLFGKISTQRHLLGIRNGIMAALPFILVGSIFLIISSIPIGAGDGQVLGNLFPEKLKLAFDLINRFTFGVMALYMSIGIGSELARLSRISSTQGAVIGAMGYIMWLFPLSINVSVLSAEELKQLSALLESAGTSLNVLKGGLWINIKELGGATAFVAIVSSTVTVEIYRVCLKYRITIRMPKQVPDAVSNSFAALVPIFFGALIIGFIRYIVGFDLANFLRDALSPMGNFLVSNLAGALIIIFLITFLWWFGVHGGSLVQSVTRPFWIIALEENQEAFKNGEKIPNVFIEPFFQWFAQVGGAGNTLGLVIVGSIFCKSATVKSISRTSLVPGIFNINEPILFGLPILLNPFMWVPFVLGPVISATVGFTFQKMLGVHWVTMAPWTMPGPIGAFFASGNQWQASISALTVLASSIAIWLPFTIAYDRFLLKKEKIDAESGVL
ncbi:PTS sugar transporter subunit IIC [Spiroplasma diminutum]|uniref:Permease IIC component n=1 Tax=Spiroplasma diminutum CUAS-1 TaxID=1276221 RepID=S5MEN6_9MOLU|nr:PTS transporter subunit EIIC [Spiroplasma diminutum]AGR42213.1 PTS system cellobiose-specific component IIC [Spiroplasma diminutum CUAS-1]